MGREVGYAESHVNFSTTATGFVIIPGLVVNFVATDRPLMARFSGVIDPLVGANYIAVSLFVDGAERSGTGKNGGVGQFTFGRRSTEHRIGGLVPGTTHSVAALVKVLGADPRGIVYGSPTSPAFLEVVER